MIREMSKISRKEGNLLVTSSETAAERGFSLRQLCKSSKVLFAFSYLTRAANQAQKLFSMPRHAQIINFITPNSLFNDPRKKLCQIRRQFYGKHREKCAVLRVKVFVRRKDGLDGTERRNVGRQSFGIVMSEQNNLI